MELLINIFQKTLNPKDSRGEDLSNGQPGKKYKGDAPLCAWFFCLLSRAEEYTHGASLA